MNSKQKGGRGEREFASFLRDRDFKDARRGQQFSGIEGEDVVGLPGHHVEVKFTNRLELHPALLQSQRDAKTGEVPLVAYRRQRGELNTRVWIAILPMDDYLRMVKELETWRGLNSNV